MCRCSPSHPFRAPSAAFRVTAVLRPARSAARCRPPAGGGRRSVPPRPRLRCPGPCPTGVGASRRPVRRSDSVDRGRQGRRPAPTSVPVRRPNWPCRGRRLPKVTSERVPGNADLPSSRRRAGRHPHPGAGRGRADPARSRLRHPVPVHRGQPARTALPRRARPPRVNRPPGLDTGSADRTCRPRSRGEQLLCFRVGRRLKMPSSFCARGEES
jgi:hypothetical protein